MHDCTRDCMHACAFLRLYTHGQSLTNLVIIVTYIIRRCYVSSYVIYYGESQGIPMVNLKLSQSIVVAIR